MIDLLRRSPRLRATLAVIGTTFGVLIFSLVLLPGRGDGRGVPAAILFFGVVIGLVNALTAAAIIVVYRTTRVINFAQAAIGVAGATLAFRFVELTSVPFPIAFLSGLLMAGLIGLLFDLVFGRRFFRAPRLVLTVVTIAAAAFLGGTIVSFVDVLPFFPPVGQRDLTTLGGAANLRPRLPFPGLNFEVGDLPLQFGFAEVFAIIVTVVALVLVAQFFRRTRAGVGVRAMSENLERATLLGISVGALSSLVWVLSSVLAGASAMLSGFLTSPASASGFAPELLLPALAAAVIARMRSIPVTVFAAVVIAVMTQALGYSLQSDLALVDFALFLVVAVGLFLQRRVILRGDDGTASSWAASEEQRPIPKELAGVGGLRLARLATLGVLGIGIVAFPFLASVGATNLGGVIALSAVIALSLVVLTGWAGQVSLGQFAFAAIGAVVASSLTTRAGLTFWLAVPLATAITGVVAGVIGIPALRVRGLFLGVATFALAVATHSTLFNERYFGWLLPEAEINRPTLFLIDFDDERSMYFLCVAALVLATVLVTNLRRSRFGRILIAVRENETNVQSFGITAIRAKVLAFVVSGSLAGFAGAIFVHQQRGLSVDSFTAQASIDVFLVAVVGGVTSVTGALLGAAYFSITKYFVDSPLLVTLIGPGGTLFLLYVAPGGLISLVTRLRDGVLRIVAQRRQLVVPSLFADYDATALAHRLIPLSPAGRNAGLAALHADDRYVLTSRLYDDESAYEELLDGTAAVGRRDTDLLAAAALSADDNELLTTETGATP